MNYLEKAGALVNVYSIGLPAVKFVVCFVKDIPFLHF